MRRWFREYIYIKRSRIALIALLVGLLTFGLGGAVLPQSVRVTVTDTLPYRLTATYRTASNTIGYRPILWTQTGPCALTPVPGVSYTRSVTVAGTARGSCAVAASATVSGQTFVGQAPPLFVDTATVFRVRTGAAPVPPPPPPPPPPSSGTIAPNVVEAETAPIRTVGAATGDGWNLYSDGELGADLTFSRSGRVEIVVRAYGAPAVDIWPIMEVRIDGVVIGRGTVSTPSYQDYSFDADVTAGVRRVTVAFTNDYYDPPTQDRNLFVDRFTVRYYETGTRPAVPGAIQITGDSVRTTGTCVRVTPGPCP